MFAQEGPIQAHALFRRERGRVLLDDDPLDAVPTGQFEHAGMVDFARTKLAEGRAGAVLYVDIGDALPETLEQSAKVSSGPMRPGHVQHQAYVLRRASARKTFQYRAIVAQLPIVVVVGEPNPGLPTTGAESLVLSCRGVHAGRCGRRIARAHQVPEPDRGRELPRLIHRRFFGGCLRRIPELAADVHGQRDEGILRVEHSVAAGLGSVEMTHAGFDPGVTFSRETGQDAVHASPDVLSPHDGLRADFEVRHTTPSMRSTPLHSKRIRLLAVGQWMLIATRIESRGIELVCR